jgi:hypothetical protein
VQYKETEGCSVRYERPLFNTRTRFIIVPKFPKGDPRAAVARCPYGSAGVYDVTFVLSVPGRNVFYEDLDFNDIMQSGDSLLFIGVGREVRGAPVEPEGRGQIVFSANIHGRLATARMRIQAENFVEAERTAFDTISRELNYWSFIYDTAIDIRGWRVIEERTDCAKFAFGSVGKVKAFDQPNAVNSIKAYASLFAAYREGMNATNPFYQALSFYKVTEGAAAERKRRARGEKGATRAELNSAEEKFPHSLDDLTNVDPLELEFFQDYLGMTFETARTRMTTVVRHAIAHLAKFDEVLDADTFDDQDRCTTAIPVLRYMASAMIKNDLQTIART